MKIIAKIKPASKKELVEKIDEHNYLVWVKAPPRDGKANAAVIKALADYFNTSPVLIEIISGHMTRTKIIKINL